MSSDIKNHSGRVNETSGRIIAGRYELVEKLARGGMGAVYVAYDTQTERKVAIKVLLPHLVKTGVNEKRFVNEADAVQRITHPNVVSLIDWGQLANGRMFIAMEYAPGEELRRYIRRVHVVRWKDAAPILLQICAGMHAAHQANVVHRDLKPSNVILLPRDQNPYFVKILDFGLAKLMENDPDRPRLTATGVVVGTASVLAPEQIRGSQIDARTDVYALGVIMYRMLCGHMPFGAASLAELVQRQLNAAPQPPSTVNPDASISAGAEAICLQALQKDPEDRFTSMQTMAEAIAQVGA